MVYNFINKAKRLKSLGRVLLLWLVSFSQPLNAQTTININDLNIRDPYILTDSINQRYLMYSSSSVTLANGQVVGGVAAYESQDLKHWSGPKQVFQADQDLWIHGRVWAPEVHVYQGNYYLFATLNSDVEWKTKEANWPAFTNRAVQIFKADNPYGPFLPFSKDPTTAKNIMALDGTLWVEKHKPYLVYCKEWVQVVDGTMELVELKKDLSKMIGKPKTLFKASEAKWSTGDLHPDQRKSYVTDGCFLYRTKTGKLLMIWSSFMHGNYAIGIAESSSGSIKGPWIQQEKPLFEKNGGHGMIFKDLNGKLFLVLHGPNSPAGKERALLFPMKDLGDTLSIED